MFEDRDSNEQRELIESDARTQSYLSENQESVIDSEDDDLLSEPDLEGPKSQAAREARKETYGFHKSEIQ